MSASTRPNCNVFLYRHFRLDYLFRRTRKQKYLSGQNRPEMDKKNAKFADHTRGEAGKLSFKERDVSFYT